MSLAIPLNSNESRTITRDNETFNAVVHFMGSFLDNNIELPYPQIVYTREGETWTTTCPLEGIEVN